MSIPEYYLHMFAGTNGDHDQYTGAGRIAIAALMAGYGLQATTKRDLQTRVGWETTPGCFLGQKELRAGDYSVRARPGLIFLTNLLDVKKAARTLNYSLNWNAVNGEFRFDVRSPVWPILARIYFMGRFMFARNVIPEEVMQILRERFNPVHQENDLSNLCCPYVMQFFADMGFFTERLPDYVDGTLLPASLAEASVLRLPRQDIFLTFANAMNYSEPLTGFFASVASIPEIVPPGTSFRSVSDPFKQRLDAGRSTVERNHRGPMLGSYYDTYTTGTPSTTQLAGTRTTSSLRDIAALFFADATMTPQQEYENGHSGRFGREFNREYAGRHWIHYVTAVLIYEFRLMLTGQEIVPLADLIAMRDRLGVTTESLIDQAPSIHMLSMRNSTLHRLVKFHLDRQNQV